MKNKFTPVSLLLIFFLLFGAAPALVSNAKSINKDFVPPKAFSEFKIPKLAIAQVGDDILEDDFPSRKGGELAEKIIEKVNAKIAKTEQKLCKRLDKIWSRFGSIDIQRPYFCENIPPNTKHNPSVSLSATPLRLLVGATTTLSWSSKKASTCFASDGWSGAKTLSGSEIVAPTATTTYSLACTGAGGTANKSVVVGVSLKPVIGHLVVSEVYYDVASGKGNEPANEWIEIYNGKRDPVDLSGYTIGDNASSSSDALPGGTIIPAGGFAVVTASSTTAGFWTIPAGVPVIVLSNSVGGNGLANGGDVIYLNFLGALVDAVSFGTNTSAFSPSVPAVPEGHSITRFNLDADTNSAADFIGLATSTPGL